MYLRKYQIVNATNTPRMFAERWLATQSFFLIFTLDYHDRKSLISPTVQFYLICNFLIIWTRFEQTVKIHQN